jgi:hypothetical protein
MTTLKKALAILITIIVLFTVVYAIQRTRIIHNNAHVYCVGIDVYWDSQCTNPCTTINWGDLYPGDVKTQQLYIKNVENTPCTLTMATGNWTPTEASNYITLSWDYAGQTLNPSQILQVTFTLKVSEQITGISNFTFDILIYAIATQ